MEKSTRNIIIFLGITAIVVGSYFAYQKYGKNTDNKNKDSVTPTINDSKRKKFDDIINAFTKGGKDVFEGITPSMYNKALINFSNNVSNDEADFLLSVSSKKESEMLPAEKIRVLAILSKIMKNIKS
jgi:hypothetical protein